MAMSMVRKAGIRGIKRVDLAYVELVLGESARDSNRDGVLELIHERQLAALSC